MSSSPFPKRLREARQAAGVTQAALAAALGLTKSSVSQYEAGKTQPTLGLVEEVAHLLGVDPAWLAGWEDGELVRRLRAAQAARRHRIAIEDLPDRASDQARADRDEAEAVCKLLDYKEDLP